MRKVDVIIAGAGFAGAIMGMVLRRLGKSVLILERGRHPRFAIGESSTPLANLLLEEIARKYDLPDLATFSKWGTWRAAHPEIACGLKRGFTFYKHEFGRRVSIDDRSQQLLVAASPHDRIADTHWYRPEFDAHLAKSACAMGAELVEEARFELREEGGVWEVQCESPSGRFEVGGKFLIDASGPRGCLFRHFGFREEKTGFLKSFPKTEALFAHFRDVKGIDAADEGLPFPVDDAAVHHVFDGGWIWVLRFNNGVVSAGVSATEGLAREMKLEEGAPAWARLLGELPTLKEQFAEARAVTPFFHQPRVAFRSPRVAGENWAMLPSAAGFVDPLFSTGFVLTLLGIVRLADALESPTMLRDYEAVTLRELDTAGELVAEAFAAFADFAKFSEVARTYFVSAIWAETLRRLGRKAPEFLFADDPKRRDGLEEIDLGGLTDHSRRNWHPALAKDLFANAWKVPATRAEVETMLGQCGF